MKYTMKGVDWRKKIIDSAEYYHDCSRMNPAEVAKYYTIITTTITTVIIIISLIYKTKIAILCNWDGYAHNGVRMAKIFPLQAAPIQVNFQGTTTTTTTTIIIIIITTITTNSDPTKEYLGSLGADHIQYIVTDKIVSPLSSEHAHSEKFVWVPPCFFVNSMAYQVDHHHRHHHHHHHHHHR